jgi:hypothetical protein
LLDEVDPPTPVVALAVALLVADPLVALDPPDPPDPLLPVGDGTLAEQPSAAESVTSKVHRLDR